MESSSPITMTTNTVTSHRRSLRNRFSSTSLASIRTLLPQYTVIDSSEEQADASSAVNADSRLPPPYGTPPSNNTTSASTSLQRATEPPRYSLLHLPQPPHAFTLASRRANTSIPEPLDARGDPPQFRHLYPIRPKKSWATLHLHSRDAVPGNPKPLQSRPRVPRLWSCDPVEGALELDLDSTQNIQQINISLSGSIVMSSVSDFEFLRHEFTLWDKSMGDPLQFDVTDANMKKFDGRLTPGHYSFPFSFPFPTQPYTSTKSADSNANSISPFPPATAGIMPSPIRTGIPKNGEKNNRMAGTARFNYSPMSPVGKAETDLSSSQIQTPSPTSPTSARLVLATHRLASLLPQSFMEKGIDPSIFYNISVRIVHGRFKTSSTIGTNIVYIPASQPHLASQKRREAYEAGALLPSPVDDPDGWFAWPTKTVYGVVNPDTRLARHTKVNCTLFVAQPLTYTRGSVIPCYLTISSDDQEAVGLLSSPKTPNVRLLRRIRYPMEEDHAAQDRNREDPGDLTTHWTWKTWRSHTTLIPTGEMKLLKHEVGRAQWWTPLKDVTQGPNVRHLEGEIHLSHHLQPSCDFQYFQVEYALELLHFQTANFEPEIHPSSAGKLRKRDNVLASNPVEITTLYRQDEPIPTTYSEPSKINIMRSIISKKGPGVATIEETPENLTS